MAFILSKSFYVDNISFGSFFFKFNLSRILIIMIVFKFN